MAYSTIFPSYRLLSFLFLCIFGGAIVGETITLSLAVSAIGPSILSKLYLINGVLLFLLPPLFFNYIDRMNRAKLLSRLLLASAGSIALYIGALWITRHFGLPIGKFLILAIYPVSYLSKTLLFLTFWTLANDVFYSGTAKKSFPRIAAWGFVGGLLASCASRVLLEFVDAEKILLLWMIAYCVAWVLAKKTATHYESKLIKKEDDLLAPGRFHRGVPDFGAILDIRLVQLIAVLYFLVFVGIFSIDYLFWKKCTELFTTHKTLAVFQFSFYLVHGIVTIAGLQFIVPGIINKWGFVKIFYSFPVALLAGSAVLLLVSHLKIASAALFISFVVVQFARQVVFENAFSPIYQMFFAAIPREKRGRAKTFLEGVVKPSAIILTGLTLILLRNHPDFILSLVCVASCAMVVVVFMLRETYMRMLVPDYAASSTGHGVVTGIGSQIDERVISMLREYSGSSDSDLREFAVRALLKNSDRQTLSVLKDIFSSENNQFIREMIARSLAGFPWNETKVFCQLLLKDSNPRIRANAILSLNNSQQQQRIQLKDTVSAMLYDSNLRVQIEAARYLWALGDRSDRIRVEELIVSLCEAKNANIQSAGLYLVGMLRPKNWEDTLMQRLSTSSIQVFAKCMDVILKNATLETNLKMCATIERLSREHIDAFGKVARAAGNSAAEAILQFLPVAQNRRMIFEIVGILNLIRQSHAAGNEYDISPTTKKMLLDWINRELRLIYRDVYVWIRLRPYLLSRHRGVKQQVMVLMEEALYDQLFRVAQWAIDVLAILDKQGIVASGQKDLSLEDTVQRQDMVEIIEAFSNQKIASLISPILEFESFEKIARRGHHVFRFESAVISAGVEYFIEAENRWVCLCGVYLLVVCEPFNTVIDTYRPALVRLSNDPNVYLSKCTRDLLLAKDPALVETFSFLETVIFFKKISLFKGIPAEKLMRLAEITQTAPFERGTIISRQGELADHLYIVRKGSVKIVKVKNEVKTILSIIRAGESYGEIGLFNQAPRSATAIANEDCELCVIKRVTLKKILLDIPEIAVNFLEIFSDKLRKSGDEVALLNTRLTNSFKEASV